MSEVTQKKNQKNTARCVNTVYVHKVASIKPDKNSAKHRHNTPPKQTVYDFVGIAG